MTKGIYCYIDKKNDNIVYVGKDSHIDEGRRRRAHLAPSNYNAQPINRILQNNPFRYRYSVLWEIDDCTDNHLNQMEFFYIKKYNPQFNFTDGGDGMTGFKHSEETRKKISENNARYWQGKTLSAKTRKKMSEAQKGKTLSEETRKKISEANKGENNPMYGKTHSEEARKKMSEAKKGKTLPEKTRKKMSESKKGENHPMYGKTLSEETRKKISESQKGENNPMYGKTHSEEARKKISEAQNTTGFYKVSISNCSSCKKGFTWRYRYCIDSQHKSISSTDLNKLKEKVLEQDLEWKIIDEEKAQRSLDLDKRGIL